MIKLPQTTIHSSAYYRTLNALRKVLLYALLLAVGLIWSVPFVWTLVSSLKLEKYIQTYPVNWIPNPATLEHYWAVMQRSGLPKWFFNSVIVSASTLALSLIVVILGAYALGRMKFRGRNFIYWGILASFLLPTEVTLVPLFLGFAKLKLLDSYFSLISVGIADAFNLFLLTQFFQAFPSDLEDAAWMDGCSRLGFIWNILLPLSKPALVTVILFNFFTSWNNFMWPLIATGSDAHRTMPVGIALIVTRTGALSTSYGMVMAGAVIACLPGLIVFFFLQKYFVQGITMVGIKG